MSKPENSIGKVVLVAAGPGDPELITVKAVRALQLAEVVLVDRLVSDEIITLYVPAGAEVVYVGKQCRRGPSTPQLTINELLVQYATAGKQVVRLKGGDVSVFSNILDELLTLAAHKIPYEIVPGVTAALGAAAYAGIPLTARGYATAIRFLTFYKSDIISHQYWKELAETTDTLVFYMSSETLGDAVELLTRHNIAGDKKIAIIEQATTPLQHVIITNVSEYASMYAEHVFCSPTLVIIGNVVSLHEQFKWVENSNSKEHYFSTVKEGKYLVSKKTLHLADDYK